jgi:Flp pilus assembly protein TadG
MSSPKASGQVIVMFALFSVAMMGLLGLAMDLGFAFAQRRSMQNAADAGALAGARIVARWSATNPLLSAQGPVEAIAEQNEFGPGELEVTDCHYVNDGLGNVGSCSLPVPVIATGVQVTVRETHSPFFIQVMPGAPSIVETAATATAHVQRLTSYAPNGPFIVCGTMTKLYPVGFAPILLDNNTINPLAIGQTFLIHGPTVTDCGAVGASFDGIADTDANEGKEIGEYWLGEPGTQAGPTRVTVSGVEGCAANTTSGYDCIMVLPIATNNPAVIGPNDSPEFYIVMYAAFRVRRVAANMHAGVLLDDYVIAPPAGTGSWTGSNGWTAGAGGVVMVRLTQ